MSRTLVELVQEPPRYNGVLRRAMVEVNREEALVLHAAKAKVASWKGPEGQKIQTYWYGGKYYTWHANIAVGTLGDDYPVPPHRVRRTGAFPSPA